MSMAECTALLNTGRYKADSNRPVTAALIPQTAPATAGLAASDSQAPCNPSTSKKPGRKMASVASKAPASGAVAHSSAPRKAARLNIGPGTAWAAA